MKKLVCGTFNLRSLFGSSEYANRRSVGRVLSSFVHQAVGLDKTGFCPI